MLSWLFLCHSVLDVWIPQPFHAEVPADWWDSEADKSLLVGVFKHGNSDHNTRSFQLHMHHITVIPRECMHHPLLLPLVDWRCHGGAQSAGLAYRWLFSLLAVRVYR